MTLLELLQRATSIANGARDGTADADLTTVAVEPLVFPVFSEVSRKLAANHNTRHLLRRTKTITFTNGNGTLTEDVLSEYLCEGTLLDTADLTKRYGYLPWNQFVRATVDTRLGYFTANESTISVIEPGSVYVSGSGLSGNLSLVVPCAVAVPTALGNQIVARDEVVDDLLVALSEALKTVERA